MRWLVLVAGLMLVATPAQSDVMNGATLKGYCDQQASETFNTGTCLGYISGIADTMYRSTGDIYGWRACWDDSVTVKDMHGVVVKFLQANPQYLDLDADSLVARALADAYPCT